MSIEIERKFLVVGDDWRGSIASYCPLRLGFLAKTARGSVRVRRWPTGASLTVKGPRIGISREEYEFSIPLEEADQMLYGLCARPLIDKVRYRVDHAGMTWDVDVYGGTASGLVLAEIELGHPDQPFALPRWVGAEVTHDPHYGSAAIAARLVKPVDGADAASLHRKARRGRPRPPAPDATAGA